MKDIKSLFEAAKTTQSPTDITAYTEAVNELLESKPSDFLSNLKYIITSDIGFPSLNSFVEKYGISIAAFTPIMESLSYCIEKCEEKKIDPSPYKDFMEKMELTRSKYQHCYDMFDFYSEGFFNKVKKSKKSYELTPEELEKSGVAVFKYNTFKPDTFQHETFKPDKVSDDKEDKKDNKNVNESYLYSYYSFTESATTNIQNSKLIDRMIKSFGEAAIADALITADQIDGKAVCQVLQYVSENYNDKVLSQWICECINDFKMNYNNEDGSKNIKSSSELSKLFESTSLDSYISSMKESHNEYIRESLLLDGTESTEMSYSEEDVSAIRDLISFKEYQITCMENTDDIMKLQKEVYDLYENYGGLLEDTADDILPMLPQQKVVTEDMSWRNTRNKKTGTAPSYLSTNHNLGYGEDEDDPNDINSYKRKSASDSNDDDDDDTDVSDDELDNDSEVGAKPSTPEERQAVNNYYYYTYNNSLNKHTDNSVNNSRRTDDHSTGKVTGSYNKDDHSHDNGNDRNKSTPHTEGFAIGVNRAMRSMNKAHNNTPVTTTPEVKHDKKKIVITPEEGEAIISKFTEIVDQLSKEVEVYFNRYPIFSFGIDKEKNIEEFRSYIKDNATNEYAIPLYDGKIDIDSEITMSGIDQYDFMMELECQYPDEIKRLSTKYDINSRHDWSDIHWTEKICGYDKTLDEICNEITNIVNTKFTMINDWSYWGDNDSGPFFGGYISPEYFIHDIDMSKAVPVTESFKDPTELDIFHDDKTDFFVEGLYNNEYEVYMDYCEAVQNKLHEVIMESGNYEPRFKYAYKAAYDFDTGHALKITYSLNPITITNVGIAKPVRDEILSIVNKTADAANNKNIFSAILTAVNGLIKSKSNIEMRKTVLTEILNKYIDQVGYVDFQAKDCRIISITDRATKEKLSGPINIVGVYAAADLNENRSLALSPYILKRMQDRVRRKGSNFKISTISVGDTQTVPTFMSTYWDRNCDKGLVNQNGDIIVDDDMDRDNLSQIISSREIQGFDSDTKNSRFSDGLGDFIDPIRSIGDSKKNKLFKKLAYNDSIKFIGQAEDISILANKGLRVISPIKGSSQDDLKPIEDFISEIDNKIQQAENLLKSDNHEGVFNILNVPETLDQQKERIISTINDICSKYGITPKLESYQFEAVGDADDNKPESDHPVKDILMNIDRKKVKSQQEMKRTVQNVQNVARAAVKPAQRTKQWVTNMVNDWKDKDENAIKEKMADPHARRNIFSAISFAIKTGSLAKAGLLLNPVFLFLSITKKVSNNKNQQRIRNEMIGELKTELEVIDAKIEDAKYNNHNKEKYQLMRLRNEINKKLLRVSGSESNKKWVKKGELI